MDSTAPDAPISAIGREYLRLHLAPEIGPIRLQNLIKYFGSPASILAASRAQLERVNGIGPRGAESIIQARHDPAIDSEVERAAKLGVRIVCVKDADYPDALLHIPDPPPCVYIRGEVEPADCVAVAVVGTRRCSHYGREQALRFGRALGAAGFTVVSGLARGIDGHAHRGALEAGGRTIAVLGSGLGAIYPREHEGLADDVARQGAVITEYATDFAPAPGNFPSRNRIITGLSLGVLVVEAGRRSGALITARLASEYNREVFAIPGRIDQPQHTEGVNRLIREGQGKLVTCLEDILDELAEVGSIMRPATDDEDSAAPFDSGIAARLTDHERVVLQAVEAGAEDAEHIAAAAKLPMGQVTSTLTSLQLKGLITRLPGNRFAKRGV